MFTSQGARAKQDGNIRSKETKSRPNQQAQPQEKSFVQRAVFYLELKKHELEKTQKLVDELKAATQKKSPPPVQELPTLNEFNSETKSASVSPSLRPDKAILLAIKQTHPALQQDYVRLILLYHSLEVIITETSIPDSLKYAEQILQRLQQLLDDVIIIIMNCSGNRGVLDQFLREKLGVQLNGNYDLDLENRILQRYLISSLTQLKDYTEKIFTQGIICLLTRWKEISMKFAETHTDDTASVENQLGETRSAMSARRR